MTGDRLLTFCVQTVHHAADKLELILEAEVDKVRVDEHAVRRHKRGILGQEHGGGRRSDTAHGFLFRLSFLLSLFSLIFLPMISMRSPYT